MSLFHHLRTGFRTLLRKRQAETEMNEDLQNYLDTACSVSAVRDPFARNTRAPKLLQ
jgi:hypothetical protein